MDNLSHLNILVLPTPSPGEDAKCDQRLQRTVSGPDKGKVISLGVDNRQVVLIDTT